MSSPENRFGSGGGDPFGGSQPRWQPPSPQELPPQGYAALPIGSNGKATAALVLGILGLVVCPLVPSILALVFGYQARSEIDRTGGVQGGRGSAVAGIVLGWVGVGVTLLVILVIVVLAAAGSNLEESNNSGFDSISYSVARGLAAGTLRLAA